MRDLCEIVLLDFAKAFDLINHEKLLVKLKANDVPPHILRWMGSFLLDRTHPPPRNSNNVEPYTFVTLFSGKADTPHTQLRYVTLEWHLTQTLNIGPNHKP